MKTWAIITLFLFSSLVHAEIYLDYYNQVGCGACAVFEKTLEEIVSENQYDLVISEYEIRYNSTNLEKFNNISDRFNIPYEQRGTPTIVLNESMVFVGALDSQGLNKFLDDCLSGECKRIENTAPVETNTTMLDIANPFTTFGAGIIAGFNPCLIAVLLFLISYSLGVSENKMRLVRLTFAFSMGIFFAYFIIGWGLLSFAGSVDIGSISTVIAFVVIILGLWTIKDYKNPKSFLVETPENVKGISESLTKRGSMMTSFVLGGIFSLVKAPCVGGIYLAILNMASSADIGTKINAVPLLLSYNLGLVFPLLLISGAVLFGVPPDAIERWRENNKYGMRIFVGITLVLVGLIMLFQEGIIG